MNSKGLKVILITGYSLLLNKLVRRICHCIRIIPLEWKAFFFSLPVFMWWCINFVKRINLLIVFGSWLWLNSHNFMIFRFALINAGVLYIYFTNFQKIDEEEYGGPWELTKEGFMTSFALFLVSAKYLRSI